MIAKSMSKCTRLALRLWQGMSIVPRCTILEGSEHSSNVTTAFFVQVNQCETWWFFLSSLRIDLLIQIAGFYHIFRYTNLLNWKTRTKTRKGLVKNLLFWLRPPTKFCVARTPFAKRQTRSRSLYFKTSKLEKAIRWVINKIHFPTVFKVVSLQFTSRRLPHWLRSPSSYRQTHSPSSCSYLLNIQFLPHGIFFTARYLLSAW